MTLILKERNMPDTREQFEQVIAVCRDLFEKKLKDYGYRQIVYPELHLHTGG